MSILQNALDSIVIGLEDFTSDDPRRLISSTRNIFAGILLLFKYKLSILSPKDSDEVLIKQKIIPKIEADSTLNWLGHGKKTVDVMQIKERFNALEIEIEWKRLEQINKFRNDIEHYYSQLSKSAIETLISNSFIIIRDFIVVHLEQDPKELLGKISWDTLVKISEVNEKEKYDCMEKLEEVEWKSDTLHEAIKNFHCIECGSNLITINGVPEPEADENTFQCRSCEYIYSFEDIVKESLQECCSYYDYQHGEEADLVTCPFCAEETYIFHEGQCALCGSTAEHTCVRCGSGIQPEEITDGSLCGYCNYVWEKVKDE